MWPFNKKQAIPEKPAIPAMTPDQSRIDRIDEWISLLKALCTTGDIIRYKCHKKWPGMCDGKTDFCGACDRVKR